MVTGTFDTLATARESQESGLAPAQAEGVATMADPAAVELRLTWRILGRVGVLLAVATALDRVLG